MLEIFWQPPLPSLQHGEILGYYVGYRRTAASSAYKYQTVRGEPGVEGDAKLSLVLEGLAKFTQYTVTVQVTSLVWTSVTQSCRRSTRPARDPRTLPPWWSPPGRTCPAWPRGPWSVRLGLATLGYGWAGLLLRSRLCMGCSGGGTGHGILDILENGLISW